MPSTKSVLISATAVGSSSSQRLIDSGEWLVTLDEGDIADAKHGAQLVSWNGQRRRRRTHARRWLRKAGRPRGVECDVALYLLV